MTTNATLEPARSDVSTRQNIEQSFSALVAAHTIDLSGTDWVSRLSCGLDRENIRCLPLSFRICKRLFDIAAALTMMVLTAPLMLTAAILIKATSPGPLIYSQTRVGLNLRSKKKPNRRKEAILPDDPSFQCRRSGRDRREIMNYGRLFIIYKFRTMRTDAERNGAQFAKQSDDRITTVGRFLRRTRIDELPQLWNILKGDMSLIGPRPERPEFMMKLQEHIPNFIDRLGLKPGMTGIAQVVNGYDNELEGFRRKVSYDLLYLQNCCLWNDIKILFRTVRTVITGDGAM